MRSTLAARVGAMALAVGVVMGALAVASPAGAATQYRRWSGAKSYTCGPASAGQVGVYLGNQNTEVAGSATGMLFSLDYIDNGVVTTSGPFPVESNGVHAYGSFLEQFPSYPFTFDFRINTILGGEIVYTSTLSVTCTADGTGTVSPVNVETPPPGTPFRRWILPKTYECRTTATGVAVVLSEQDVLNDSLPAGAQFTLGYIDDGVVTTDGPFPAEANGVHHYGAFSEPFASYPFTFDFRISTIVGGDVVYTSTLHTSCTGDTDGVRQATVTNVGPIVPNTTTTTTSTTTTTTTTTTVAPTTVAPTTAPSTTAAPSSTAAVTSSSVASEPVVVFDPILTTTPLVTVSGTLPRTGGDHAGGLTVALATSVVGGALLLLSRRPRVGTGRS